MSTNVISGNEIEIKSTGQLIDESATLAFRVARSYAEGAGNAELSARLELLVQALDRRLGDGVGSLVFDLAAVLQACWVAQEIVMADHDDAATARAARQAQRLNGHRARLVRRIDALLGESRITVLVKTYDGSGE